MKQPDIEELNLLEAVYGELATWMEANVPRMRSDYDIAIIIRLRQKYGKGAVITDEMMADAKRHTKQSMRRSQAIARGEPDAWDSDVDDPRWSIH